MNDGEPRVGMTNQGHDDAGHDDAGCGDPNLANARSTATGADTAAGEKVPAVAGGGLFPNFNAGESTRFSPAAPSRGFPTLGGKQFWTDFRWWQGWRLQQHQVTGHWRVLSPENRRQASGAWRTCWQHFAERRQTVVAPPMPKAVILLHGLIRTSRSLRRMAAALQAHGWETVIDFRYASTRATMAKHAAGLRSVVRGLPAETRLSFVGHSMGNIVLRHAIGDWQRRPSQRHVLERMDRVVMLAPPNQGSAIARTLAWTGLFQWVTGRAGLQLGRRWSHLEADLGIPPCPFAIIAGDVSAGRWNPLVPSPNDLIVSVQETDLPGATERLVVPSIHSLLMDNPQVLDATVRFLGGNSCRQANSPGSPASGSDKPPGVR
jgi:hypothetical protein